MKKKRVAVLFGGQSSEHEISCISADTVIKSIDREKYDLLMIGITKDGHWYRTEREEAVAGGSFSEDGQPAVLSPDAGHKGFLILKDGRYTLEPADVVFPVLHGLYGEDGTVQGLLELSGIPYVGCGPLSSAVSMDKLFTKIVADSLHIRQAAYAAVTRRELDEPETVVGRIEEAFSYPVFVKPSNAGSSQGVTKAHNREELKEGLLLAARHDRKLLVEETIVGRELECAVLGGTHPRASGVGEILSGADFYSYDAKYHSEASKTILSPELPEGVEKQIRDTALRIFQGVDGYGMARVDFFLKEDTKEVVFNEINTIPGFTSISMYPMLWEAKGLRKSQLVEKLLQSAFDRREGGMV